MTQYALVSSYPYGFNGNGARCITSFGSYGGSPQALSWPWYCDLDKDGIIYLADTENHRIKMYQSRTYCMQMIPFGDDNPKSVRCLMQPKSVKRSYIPGTSLVVCDTRNRRVALLRVDDQTQQMEHAYSFGSGYFAEPVDAACNPRNGDIVVVDSSLNRVSIHDQRGQPISLCEQPGFSLKEPSAVVIAPNGNILVSDTGNNCIRKYTGMGENVGVIGCAGEQLRQFNHPRGLAFDNKGYFYVADEYNNRVQRFSPDFTHVTEVVSNIPLPKGVAAADQLIVTCADQTNFIKVYYP